MFDPTLVVQSAISSFNNIALRSPDFFWSALLCLPIFVVFWLFAPQISARFLPDSKKRMNIIATWGIVFIAAWLLTHESFNALRDGVSLGISALTAVCVFALTLFAGWRVPPASNFIKTKEKWRKKIDIATPIIIAALIGLCAWGTWQTILVQFIAALFGFYSGRLMIWRNRRQMDSNWMMIGLITLLTFGLVMQPEFFRFGQLGHLTVAHIFFLIAALVASTSSIMMRLVRPTGWLRKSWYRRMMLLARSFCILVFVLFVLTESALAFAALAVVVIAQEFIAIRHRPQEDANAIKNSSEDMWILSLGLFGLLAAMPTMVCAAIILVRGRTKFDAKGAIKTLL